MARIPINIQTGNIKEDVKDNNEVIVGIDLGTTNSVISYVSEGKTTILHSEGKKGLVPSVIHFAEDGQILIGEAAQPYLLTAPENTIYSVKRLLGKSLIDLESYTEKLGYSVVGNQEDDNKLLQIEIGGKYYNPIYLSSLILKELKQTAENVLGSDVTKAVITVPAYFNDTQRQATRDAGKLAGLDVLRIINEPTAASLAYAESIDEIEQKNIAVFDLGGGTFDISILYVDRGIFEVLATYGDTFLGGDDVDNAIVQHWATQHNLTDISGLKHYAEDAKKQLSTQDRYETTLSGNVELALKLAEFEEIVKPIINKTLEACKQALKDAKLTTTDINQVIMVGGSTRIPAIKRAVSELFGQAVYDDINPDEVVARGAAIQADILAGNRKDLLLLDVTPLSLGIETVGGLMDVIIGRNSKVPCGAGRNYTTSVDGQTKLKVAIYQGERDLVKDNRKLGECILTGIPPMPAGIPKIEIKFMLDADGIMTVHAEEQRSNTKTSIQVQSQYGISQDEMGRMLLDSIQNAESDMQTRSLVEATTEATMILQSTDKFIEQNADWLSEANIAELNKHKNAIKDSITSNNKDSIMSAMEALNKFSRPLAEKALDKAVDDKLGGTRI